MEQASRLVTAQNNQLLPQTLLVRFSTKAFLMALPLRLIRRRLTPLALGQSPLLAHLLWLKFGAQGAQAAGRVRALLNMQAAAAEVRTARF
jgi:hypothetical protein